MNFNANIATLYAVKSVLETFLMEVALKPLNVTSQLHVKSKAGFLDSLNINNLRIPGTNINRVA